MKALSFHQPRAEQIVRGEKTVDVRTWKTSYRGPLAVHAPTTRRAGRCRALGFDPDTLAYGALIGTVVVTDIRPLDADTYAALQDAHRLEAPYPGTPCYAWFLASPQRFPAPIPTRGARQLFEVDVPEETGAQPGAVQAPEEPTSPQPASPSEPESGAGTSATPAHRPTYRTTQPPEPDPARPFALYTVPEEGNGYRVALYQWVPAGRTASQHATTQQAPGALWSLEVGGAPLQAVTDHLLAALRANDYKATDLARAVGSETPFYLEESSGLRLALILIAVKPLTRYDRIEAIGQGVQAMSDEEAYYWFSKCTADDDATRAQKALRVLLADG